LGVLRIGACAALSFALLGSGAQAAEAFKTIRVVGDDIRVPIPEGYCEPRSQYADAAQMASALDNQNVTFLSLISCKEMDAGGPMSHFIYIKAPKNALNARVGLAELLKGMGEVPPSELSKALEGDRIDAQIEKDAGSMLGRRLEVKTEIKPAASDAFAYYLAGTVAMDAGDGRSASGVAVALTAVKGHVISYNTYAPPGDLASVREALAQAKQEVRRLVEANR
jgi:hypothetical protein